jgi:hypothetical protein
MKLSVAIALTLIYLISPVSPILAQSVSTRRFTPPSVPRETDRPNSRIGGGASHAMQFIPPEPPGLDAPTGRPRGGASRGQCPDVAQPLTALVPAVNQPNRSSLGSAQTVWGLTLAERPSFWFYVPYTLNPEVGLEFVLLDENDNTVYQGLLETPSSSPGIVNVTLPSTAKALEVGKMYRWYFMVYCAGEDPVFTEGAIQRIDPPAALSQVSQLAPRERAAAYAANGIWFDALNAVAMLHRENPNDAAIAIDWAALLRSADLGDIAQQPFVQCCTPEGQ